MHPAFETCVLDLVSAEEPVTCVESDSVASVIELMRNQKVGSVVITRGAVVEGIFTERDVLNKIDRSVDQDAQPIGNFMVRNPVCLSPHDKVKKAIILMRVGRFRHLPIVDEEKKLQFVISVRDVVNFVADAFSLKTT